MTDLATSAEPERDRWGRPLVIPPGGGKPVAYTRATTWAGAIDDQSNLAKWKMRMVAAGLAARPDLHLRASSLGLPPIDPDEEKRWKRDMGQVTDQAVEAAAASAAATIGTSVHALTERIDRGLELGPVPAQYQPHLDAYRQATQGFRWHYIEQFTVLDDMKIGGTPDRIGEVPGQPKLIISDIKTGSTDYGIGKMCIQLAIYAHSVLYDVRTGQRQPIGDVDQERGLILALSAKTGKLEMFWIDLQAGWRAAQLAGQVREWRSKDYPKNLTEPYVPPSPQLALVRDPAPGFPQSEADAALVHAIKTARTPDDLVHLWHLGYGRGEWTDLHTQLAAARKRELLGGVA